MKKAICFLISMILIISGIACAFADDSDWYCPTCGQQLSGSYSFCPFDGSPSKSTGEESVNSAITENQTWDCPECGKTGNTRNYCGGCAHPAPWIENPDPDKTVSIGDIVKFGHYEQDNNPNNGPEEIEWIVLDIQNGKALLISKYGLDARSCNSGWDKEFTWRTCTLRTWLNYNFLNTVFNKKEQSAILTTSVSNIPDQGYSGWNTDGGKDTRDQIFLLSYTEANRYFGVTYDDGNNIKARVQPTAYAISKGATTTDSIGLRTENGSAAGWWWLRSPGDNPYHAACVRHDGSLKWSLEFSDYGCVRPALWVNLGSDIFYP